MRSTYGVLALWVAASAFAPTVRAEAEPVGIRVAHYNVLASYAGANKEPWFLHPLDLSEERRAEIMVRYYQKDEEGKFVHSFADGYGGSLSEEERKTVEANNEHFEWSSRGPRVMKVVRGLEADIVSLVELDHFEAFKQNFSDTFEAAFARRPRDESSDGSSLFWRRDRFELMKPPISVTFADWEPRRGEVHREDRVMLAVALRERPTRDNPGRRLVAASVHLMRNPEDVGRDAMRMLEVSQMMRALSCFVAEVGAEGLVVMGDFNAVPQSWTHLFALHGWQDCLGSEKRMKDAFDEVEWGPESEACTTRTRARSMWVDYIFYSGRTMLLQGPPEVERCPPMPIPDAEHPSDHLPIAATLRFRDAAVPLDQRARGPEEASCAEMPDEAVDALWPPPIPIGPGRKASEQEPPQDLSPSSCESPPPLVIRNRSRGDV